MIRKDTRNVKLTQFDPGQVAKATFSELQSANRTVDTTSVLKDAYTHFTQEVDAAGRPTLVEYFQATLVTIDEITFVPDVAGSLQGTAVTLVNPITKKSKVLTIGTDVIINNNDSATLVQIAFFDVIKDLEDFSVDREGTLSSSIQISYHDFGEADTVDLGTTGFSVNRLETGDEIKVGEIELSYDGSGSPIWNGNTLFNHNYNITTGAFEVGAPPEVIDFSITAINLAPNSIRTVDPIGTDVGLLSTVGGSGTITYTLLDNTANFEIVGSTVRTLAILPESNITVSIRAEDAFNNILESTVTVSVLNVSVPTGISVSNIIVSEGLPVSSLVGTISTVGGTAPFTYTLEADLDNKFTVVGDSLLLSDALDYDTKQSHIIQIKVVDTNGFEFTDNFTITVTELHISNYRNNKAMQLDSSIYGEGDPFTLTNNFTASARVKIPDTDTHYVLTAFAVDGGKVFSFRVSDRRLNIIIALNGDDNAKLYTSDTRIVLDEWTSVAFTYNNNVLLLYINGVESTTNKATDLTVNELPLSTAPLSIGKFTNSAGDLSGLTTFRADEIAVYDRVLTESEISEVHELAAPDLQALSSAPNLIHWYNMEEETYPNLIDKAGSNDMLLFNGDDNNFVEDAPYDFKSVRFDGVAEYLNIGQVSGLQNLGLNPFTISVRHKRGSDHLGVIMSCLSAGNFGWRMWVQDSFYRFQLSNRAMVSTVLGGAIGVYADFTVTYDGVNIIRMYLNTTLRTSSTGVMDVGQRITTGDAEIGRALGASYFDGNIKSIAIFDTEFDANEVSELYSNGSIFDPSFHSKGSNLVYHYKMGDGDTYPIIKEEVENAEATMIQMDTTNIEED